MKTLQMTDVKIVVDEKPPTKSPITVERVILGCATCPKYMFVCMLYAVASVSRIDKIIGLFCKIAL